MTVLLYIVITWGGGALIGWYVGDHGYALRRYGRTPGERLLITVICHLFAVTASVAWASKWSEWLL